MAAAVLQRCSGSTAVILGTFPSTLRNYIQIVKYIQIFPNIALYLAQTNKQTNIQVRNRQTNKYRGPYLCLLVCQQVCPYELLYSSTYENTSNLHLKSTSTIRQLVTYSQIDDYDSIAVIITSKFSLPPPIFSITTSHNPLLLQVLSPPYGPFVKDILLRTSR